MNDEDKLQVLVDSLMESYTEHGDIIRLKAGSRLNRSVIIDITDKLRYLIFPGFLGKKNISAGALRYYAGDLIEEISFNLSTQIGEALCHCEYFALLDKKELKSKADGLCYEFLSKLPEVRALLADDVDAAYDGDPAAFDKDEIISSYPGIFAISIYRLAHVLDGQEIPLIPRIMTEYAHSTTGIDIHPGAKIGRHFFIDHGTGIVVGQTCVIGDNVKIYQGVTLGGLSTRGGHALSNVKRHPTIEDNVTIYAGASIFGGTTIIGEGSVIGSNAFITSSVPPNSRITYE
jgi:serine O-acetyltransferase